MKSFSFEPIGYVRTDQKYKYDAPRQGVLNTSIGSCIELLSGHEFEKALTGVEEFERLWLIYQFHQNQTWNPMLLPPREVEGKKGVFATRAPYRPNPIGLSCVRLEKKEDLKLWISESDLLDGTPILDIKPYIDYSDSFVTDLPDWLSKLEEKAYRVVITEYAEKQMAYITKKTKLPIKHVCENQLANEPLNKKKKRVEVLSELEGEVSAVFSYRTWRLFFSVNEDHKTLILTKVSSGYTKKELLEDTEDPYGDKKIHLAFNKEFGR